MSNHYDHDAPTFKYSGDLTQPYVKPGNFLAACNKPPLGLRPRYIVTSQRVHEILEAMTRYAEHCKPIPEEWLEELRDLNASQAA